MAPSRFGVFYDFRNPAPWREPWDVRYRKILEQIDWVESTPAFGEVSVSEHHFVDDGYTPSVLALSAAIAARTTRVGVSTNILQLPLHHPLRVAEDALTVDALSAGRFRLGVAVGYRELEFEALGTSTRDRASRMEEALQILRLAFAGEPFRFEGRHWSIPELGVRPGPVRPGGPPIWLGGTAPAALDRAARTADGFMASVNAEVVAFHGACERLGAGRKPASRTAWMVVDEDPERALAALGEHMLYQVNQYIDYGFLKVPPYTDPRRLIQDGFYTFVDAEGALAALAEAGAAGVDEVHFFGMLPGEDVAAATVRLEYLAAKVLPRLASGR
ncbi:LLM class flavin-dependent oxidoreductase [Acrocarpospora macrocephala]|uniref:Monooxygenase n=1 Tax=Acrocarpospora macrocephala TaxID=150177 RepID=A0A5M3WJI2_9ACTN|nr:LLM class flavin-dependent oxidoreductase [Acrocarpospora macrocephala]GES07203.1 monooxygenase [Acrocarpospora macrocephala]